MSEHTLADIATAWDSATSTPATWTTERIACLTKARELRDANEIATHADVVSFLIGMLASADHTTAVESARIAGDAVAVDRSGAVVPFRAWFCTILEGISRGAHYEIGELSVAVPDVDDEKHASATVCVAITAAGNDTERFRFVAAPDVPAAAGTVLTERGVPGSVVEALARMAHLRTDAEREASRMNLRKYLA